MDIRRRGCQQLSVLLVIGLATAAHAGNRLAQEGRIQFVGAVLPTTGPGALPAAGSVAFSLMGEAETHVESLEAVRQHAPPELLDYFASYAGRDTRVVVTTYN